MKAKSLILLVVATGCGFVAMFGVQKALKGKDEKPADKVQILVATVELRNGDQIDQTNTEFREVPADSLPPDAVTDRSQYEERVVKVHTLPNDWITMSRLSAKGDYGVANQIPEGMRVITVSVNQTTSHSGMLLPGNRVDVLITYQARTEMGSVERTRTVLQYLEVFAVDKLVEAARSDVNALNARNVSLLVTPEQAQLLLLCEKRGEIHLALRSTADKEQLPELATESSQLDQNGNIADFGKAFDDEQDSLVEEEESDANDALDAEVADAEDEDEPEEPVEPEKWQITIFEGNDSRIEEVEVPVSADPVTDAASPAGTSDDAPRRSFWKGLIGTYFRGA